MQFERNHNLIPEIDLEDYELHLMKDREDEEPETLTFDDVKALPWVTFDAYHCCAGNKRRYLQDIFPTVKGLKWHGGAIANSKWKGIPMRWMLLEKMGYKEEDLKGKHLVAFAYDADFQGKHYEVSIPIEHALDPKKMVHLVYECNGQLLEKEHGFPVRLMVPGCIAVRSCKWVHKLFVSDEEADSAP